MSIVNAREILMSATRGKYAVGAFNITNIIQMEGVVAAHEEMRAPLIIQTSVTPSKFLGQDVVVAVYRSIAESAKIPICLHLDHCREVDYCKSCADAGWTNIMIDASKQLFDENIQQTKEVVAYCHSVGDITVEGELGTVSGVEDQIIVAEDASQLCGLEQALDFVEETGVDLLAPAIGTAHGVYKTKKPKVDFDRFEKIFNLLNGEKIRIPLVIHGGTGLPEDYVTRLVALGGAKFNVSTDMKRTWIDATYEYISAAREEYNPGKLDIHVKNAVTNKVKAWIHLFGSAGKA
ncbi:MAG: class II fructose-bisphosphate aldolase family protein [Calditrichales bacterium]|nr:class II fructose-bisphosphate aldolase family protein [Calditrichales bacterium]